MILQQIRDVRKRLDAELIIVDGGSTDSTVQICEKEDVRVLSSKKGRGSQFKIGAEAASNELLVFLHADTKLPDETSEILTDFFSDPENLVGAFTIRFDHKNIILDLISISSRVDTVLTSFGDQCIFMRKAFYNEISGFPDWPLFEDMKILQKARRKTKVHKIIGPVISSSRRFKKNGVLYQLVLNAWLILLYYLGVHPHDLAMKYG